MRWLSTALILAASCQAGSRQSILLSSYAAPDVRLDRESPLCFPEPPVVTTWGSSARETYRVRAAACAKGVEDQGLRVVPADSVCHAVVLHWGWSTGKTHDVGNGLTCATMDRLGGGPTLCTTAGMGDPPELHSLRAVVHDAITGRPAYEMQSLFDGAGESPDASSVRAACRATFSRYPERASADPGSVGPHAKE